MFRLLPEITSVGEMIFDPNWATKLHADQAHELLHVIKGSMVLTYPAGPKFRAESGDTLLNPAGSEHRDVFDLDDELDIFFVQFRWEHADLFFRQVDNRCLKNLPPETDSEIRRIFDAMRGDLGSGECDRAVANARLMNILLLIHRAVTAPGPGPETSGGKRKRLVSRAKAYIDRFFRDSIRLEDVAEDLQVSPFYLSRIFSRESDFSLVEYLTEKRLGEAKKLLGEGRFHVAEVARMVGYEDANYFSKVFKRRVGCPPGMYRRGQNPT
jgi:AraC-like DNA-binding protein